MSTRRYDGVKVSNGGAKVEYEEHPGFARAAQCGVEIVLSYNNVVL